MHVTFAPRGILQIENARLMFRNFEGRGDKYNRAGDRNFALRINEEEIKDALIREGWNVRVKPPRNDDEDGLMYLPVKVKFNEYGPRVYLITNGAKNELDEETVAMLDRIDIEHIDMYIRPYDWDVNGKQGRTAYLEAIYVTQRLDYLASKYADEEYPEE